MGEKCVTRTREVYKEDGWEDLSVADASLFCNVVSEPSEEGGGV